MSTEIQKFIEEQKCFILQEKKRLGVDNNAPLHYKDYHQTEESTCDNNDPTQNNNKEQSINEENKENILINCELTETTNKKQTLPFNEPLEFKANSKQDSNKVTLEEKKQAFIDRIIRSDCPFFDRSDVIDGCAMLRYGEYSPNNPQLRVTAAAPYLGLGEYEQRRNHFLQKQKAEYLRHIAKKNESVIEVSKSVLSDNRGRSRKLEKSVQTDIKNIHTELIQYELHSQNSPEKELSPHPVSDLLPSQRCRSDRKLSPFRVDQRLTSAQNALLNSSMDKPKGILSNRRTGSPRERLLSELYPSTFMDTFSYQSSRSEEAERERVKRETYQQDLRLQIDEKRRLQQMREEQERREQELENRRLEQQLLRMQEERLVEEQRRNRRDERVRRHSEDLLRRKQELQSRTGYRKHTDSESSVIGCLRTNPDVAAKALSHYSPPVSRRNPYSFNLPSTSVFADSSTSRYNPSSRFESYHRKESLNRMDSLNALEPSCRPLSTFSRFDSLSKIDSLNQRMESLGFRESLSDEHRRHSATQQDLCMTPRKSPRLQRRSSSSRFDDPLPIPVLKARSPVAKELKNSVPFNSLRHGSEAARKLEDRWQIPAVQKNIVNYSDPSRDGQNRNILTQLGAIRMQLQQEQLRMDETLRKRGISQSKAVDFN